MNEHQKQSNSELSIILAKMADLIDFQGINPTDVNDRSILGETPLHFAAVSGDVRVGKILLDAKANPNVHGEYGNTPLHEAVGQKKYEFVKLLLAHGASKELKNDDNTTPVEYAEQLGDSVCKKIFG